MRNFKIGTVNIYNLFTQLNVKLSIPDYQRPYTWTEEHINDLLTDWTDHFFNNNNSLPSAIEYFMGSIMIHNNNGEYEVIDGQQRLTTLLIMDYVWNKENSALQKGILNFNYNSRISEKHIHLNRDFLNDLKGNQISNSFSSILKKLVCSIIITQSEDDAFVFFESQNNRGLPLAEVDFLKSYHLRELNNYEEYVKHFAKKFDQINALNNNRIKPKSNLKTLNELFIKNLWRSRFWSKNKLVFASRKLLLDTFQRNTIVFDKVDSIKLYPTNTNIGNIILTYNSNLQTELTPRTLVNDKNNIDLPFSINQPIQRGIGFFLYTEKYTSIFNHIFREDKIEEITKITTLVYSLYNNYFIDLFHLAIVSYYDKFGKDKIEAFCKWFEHFMGAYRMNRASIGEQSQIVLLRDYGNVIQLIEHSYLSDEVIATLKNYVPEHYYNDFIYNTDEQGNTIIFDSNQEKLSAARQNYYQEVRVFYKEQIQENNKLTAKKYWIYGSLT